MGDSDVDVVVMVISSHEHLDHKKENFSTWNSESIKLNYVKCEERFFKSNQNGDCGFLTRIDEIDVLTLRSQIIRDTPNFRRQ